MRPEDGAPARLRSGRGRLFPPLCFKLWDDPFNFISPAFSIFSFWCVFVWFWLCFVLIFWLGNGKRGWCFPLSRVTTLASSAFSVWWRPGRDGPWSGGSVARRKIPRQPREKIASLPRQRTRRRPSPVRSVRVRGVAWGSAGVRTEVSAFPRPTIAATGCVRPDECPGGGAGLPPPFDLCAVGGCGGASRALGCGAVSAPRWWGLRRSGPLAPRVSGIWGRRAVLELSVLLQARCMLGGWGMFYVGLPLSKHPSRSRGSSVGQGSGCACPSQLPLLALEEGGSSGGKETLDIPHSTPSYPVVWRSLGQLSCGQGSPACGGWRRWSCSELSLDSSPASGVSLQDSKTPRFWE